MKPFSGDWAPYELYVVGHGAKSPLVLDLTYVRNQHAWEWKRARMRGKPHYLYALELSHSLDGQASLVTSDLGSCVFKAGIL